jgi:hypothetical protein
MLSLSLADHPTAQASSIKPGMHSMIAAEILNISCTTWPCMSILQPSTLDPGLAFVVAPASRVPT